MRTIALVMMLGCLAAAPSGEPTAAPENAAATLLDGQLELDVPEGWSFSHQSNDGKVAYFIHDEGKANFMLQANPQASAVPQSARLRQALGQETIEKLTEAVVQLEGETITRPRLEPDNRLFVRVRHTYRLEGVEVDQMLSYRVMGRNLLMVSASAQDLPADQAEALHDQAVSVLLSVRPAGRTARPAETSDRAPRGRSTAFAQAGVRITGPAGWQATENDNATGVIVTYRHPDDDDQIIMVSVRPLPEDMPRGVGNRQRVAEQLAAAEKAEFRMEGAEPSGPPEVVHDPRFVRKTRLHYEGERMKVVVESRQILVGDVLVSVTSLSDQAEAERAGALADSVATDARSLPR